jgi:dihydrofolate reductase
MPIEAAQWQEIARTRHQITPDDSVEFSYVTYRRR